MSRRRIQSAQFPWYMYMSSMGKSVCLSVGRSVGGARFAKLGGEYGEVVVFEDARVAYVRLG